MNIHWKDWYWSWNSNTLATWWEELTHLKRPWRWESLKAGGEGGKRGWDSWMASPTQWTWVWASSQSCWWTEKPSRLQSMGSQRVEHNWVTELTDDWVFVAVCGLSLAAMSRGYSWLWCVGFSLWWLLLWSTGSKLAGFSSCDTWTQQLQLTGSRVEGSVQQFWHMGLGALWHVRSSRTRDGTPVPCMGKRFLIHCASKKDLELTFERLTEPV